MQLAAVREAAGAAGPDEARLAAMMNDEDFDPAAYDAAMASAFGGDYYEVRASSLHHPIPPLFSVFGVRHCGVQHLALELTLWML